MKKELYIYRDPETNKIEDIMVRPLWTEIDEDRTWFYYEWIIELDDIQTLLKTIPWK